MSKKASDDPKPKNSKSKDSKPKTSKLDAKKPKVSNSKDFVLKAEASSKPEIAVEKDQSL